MQVRACSSELVLVIKVSFLGTFSLMQSWLHQVPIFLQIFQFLRGRCYCT
ncbi:hypothetical protein MtrunA17_Chr2g0297661 [Medicago truncatula]|uniref:Transmembrane protein n=1 Tax=Medicago truncatula TaxID=3880 RepID=A0A396J5G9_MEDTR|nr:hypothetical protein MtrunA17_Chr2g0297661 [Medicago truncatula]